MCVAPKSTLKFCTIAVSLSLVITAAGGCRRPNANAAFERQYFGKVEPPAAQELRYVSGPEPESLDPQLSTGQGEARLYMALYEGLVEYHPATLAPIPGVAERWEVKRDSAEFVFHLRRDAKWSNGEPITAHDFVYTVRRGLSPRLAARSAGMAYYIKYAQGYNARGCFARDPASGAYLLEKDFGGAPEVDPSLRLVLPGAEAARADLAAKDARLKEALAGKELVPVAAEDVGVEAADDYTLRVTLKQPAPFFVGTMAHQFFRAVPRGAIERYGNRWTDPAHIVTSGAFRLESLWPYHEIVVAKNPHYWDAKTVSLEKIRFYPMAEATTMLNLYKAGEVDALYNHTVPPGWVDAVRPLRDYVDAPESAITYVMINTSRPPMDDLRVRRAFNLATNKRALAALLRTAKPLSAFTPEGIFADYPQPKGADYDPERARQLLAEAGYRGAAGGYDASRFPADRVEYTYNASDINRQVAEVLQAQWKQNLGITVALKSRESNTFLDHRSRREYNGFARGAWGSDYMDPYSFLNIFASPGGDNGSGWWDPRYPRMLDAANRAADPQQRYRMLAEAEAFMLAAQPVIPLTTAATNYLKKPYVKGLYPNPMTLHAWKFVYIERDPAKWVGEESVAAAAPRAE